MRERINRVRHLLLVLLCSCGLFQGCCGQASDDRVLLNSYGGSINKLVVHVMNNRKFCQQEDESLKTLRERLQTAVGEENLCLLNHVVVPNWQPSCRSGLAGWLKDHDISCLEGLGCDIDGIEFPEELVQAKQEYCRALELTAIMTDPGVEIAGDQLKRIEQMELELKRKASEWFVNGRYPEPDKLDCPSGPGPVSVFYENYCVGSDRTFCDCVKDYNANTNLWIQDLCAVYRNSGSGPGTLLAPYLPSTGERNSHVDAEYLIKQCDCTYGQLDGQVRFQGGDMLVAEEFVLIGKDIVNEYFEESYASELREKIDLKESDLTVENIEKLRSKVQQILTGNGKQVFFVGAEGAGNWPFLWYSNPSYQPTYHIDMFLSLMGETKKGTFTYLIARPDIKYKRSPSTADSNFISAFNLAIDGIEKGLNEMIETHYNSVNPIVVPMLGDFESTGFTAHYSFINGVSFQKSTGDSITFLYSIMVDSQSNRKLKYDLAKEDFEARLRENGISPIGLAYDYGQSAGLHCRLKVFGRDPILKDVK